MQSSYVTVPVTDSVRLQGALCGPLHLARTTVVVVSVSLFIGSEKVAVILAVLAAVWFWALPWPNVTVGAVAALAGGTVQCCAAWPPQPIRRTTPSASPGSLRTGPLPDPLERPPHTRVKDDAHHVRQAPAQSAGGHHGTAGGVAGEGRD